MRPPIFHRWFGYELDRLPNPLLRELEQGVADIEGARERSGASIGYPGWGVIYYVTACAIDPKRPATIIETGTNWGASTIVLASAIKDSGAGGVVHTIEIEPENCAKAREHFERAGLSDIIVLHEGDTREVLPKLITNVDEVSACFLDGGHLIDLVRTEFETVLPKLSRTGIVMMDNTYQIAEPHEDQRVHGFLRGVQARHGGNLINLPFCSWHTPGLAIWQGTPF